MFVCAVALSYKPDGHVFDFRCDHWNFSLTYSFRSHCGPAVDSASDRNEYQGYLLGVKAVGAWGWQPYHLKVQIFHKFSEPQPSGSLRACQVCAGVPVLAFVMKAKAYGGGGGRSVALSVLNHGTGWAQAVKFNPGNESRTPLNTRRLCGPHR